MADRCPTNVKYEFHGMDMDIYKDFSPSEEYKMTEYQHGYQDGFQAGVIYERSQVKPKRGRWILNSQYGTECSECGTAMFKIVGAPYTTFEPNYCPNCGAKMDEVEE